MRIDRIKLTAEMMKQDFTQKKLALQVPIETLLEK